MRICQCPQDPPSLPQPLDQCLDWRATEVPSTAQGKVRMSQLSQPFTGRLEEGAPMTLWSWNTTTSRGQHPRKGGPRGLSVLPFPREGSRRQPWSPLPCGRAEKLGIRSTSNSESRENRIGAWIASRSQETPCTVVNSAK